MESFYLMAGVFTLALFFRFPIAIAIGFGLVSALVYDGVPVEFVAQMAFSGLDNFTFLAIPMFVLAGYIMETGGLSQRLVNFASSIVGTVTGGLGLVTVVACMFFASICGSSPATVAAIGSMMIPSMIRRGYDPHFAGAITASSGSLGILLPPSIPMVVYAVTAEVSVGEMFTAGFIPGFLVGLGLMVVVYFSAKKRGYKGLDDSFSGARVLRAGREAIWALLTPMIILGGIYSGKFTPTEASVVAVLYAIIVGLFIHRELKLSDLPKAMINATVTSGSVLIILSFAAAFARYITLQQVPNIVANFILSFTMDATVFLMVFVVLVFFTGMFLETGAQILIYTPLFLPVLSELGISPIHFGVILIVGTELGLLTPPVGINLFVTQSFTGSTIWQLTKAILPFLVSMLLCQILLVFCPWLVTVLPDMVYK